MLEDGQAWGEGLQGEKQLFSSIQSEHCAGVSIGRVGNLTEEEKAL